MRAPITPLVPPYHPQAAPLSGYGDIKIGTFVCIYWFYTEVVVQQPLPSQILGEEECEIG